MHRVFIVGNAGSGKTTLAYNLGKKLGLSVFHLDMLYWKPKWILLPEENHLPIVEFITQNNTDWVIEGVYLSTFEYCFRLADEVVFLDFPAGLCLWRSVARNILYIGRVRPGMAEGCKSRISKSYLKYIIEFDFKIRPFIMQAMQAKELTKRIYILRNIDEVNRFMGNIDLATVNNN